MPHALADSYRHCQALARRTGRNFYFSFLTLPRPLLRDMCVLYAFMRHTDDLCDAADLVVPERRRRLAEWRAQLGEALELQNAERKLQVADVQFAGCNLQSDDAESAPRAASPGTIHGALVDQNNGERILPALADVVRRHHVPPEYLHDVISGVESDLSPQEFETFDDLRRYCYRVAGAVGLCCIHVWGFRDESAPALAVDCGIAFQLTNILRDLGEDARIGRIYLPRSELARFGYTPQDLAAGVRNDSYRELMRFQVARARDFYARAGALYESIDRRGRPVLSVMFRIYGGLLEEMERRDYDVFSRRVQLSTLHKLSVVLRSMLGQRFRVSNTGNSGRPWTGFLV